MRYNSFWFATKGYPLSYAFLHLRQPLLQVKISAASNPAAATMMKSLGASAILLAATSSCNAFLSTTTTKRPSSSSLAATPILGPINEDIFSTTPPLRIEGNSLKTWSGFQSDRVQVSIKSMGRPVEASVELWQTPSVSDYDDISWCVVIIWCAFAFIK